MNQASVPCGTQLRSRSSQPGSWGLAAPGTEVSGVSTVPGLAGLWISQLPSSWAVPPGVRCSGSRVISSASRRSPVRPPSR